MQCVVLAGGLATRMRPLTDEVPKLLLPVAGRTFADWQLDWLREQGVAEVVYCIGHLGERIRDHIGDGSSVGVRVEYVDEGEQLRGTAGALRFAADADRLADRFLVLYGDSYLDISIADVWRAFERSGRPALMTVFRNDGRWDRSNVKYNRGEVLHYNKHEADPESAGMRYIDYGLLAFTRSAIDQFVPSGIVMDLADVQQRLSELGQLAGFEAKRRFYEVGSAQGLADLEAALAEA